MKIALIGLGDIASKAYLPILSQTPNIELILCSRNIQVLKNHCHRYQIKQSCTNIFSLKELNPDGVMIHTSSESHHTIASYFLKLGIPVFVDKPGAMTFHEFRELSELSEQKNTPLFVGFNRRYIPIWNEAIHSNDLRSIHWKKNRVNLVAMPRDYIFNDFIHVIDSVNIDGELSDANININFIGKGSKLSTINVEWKQSGKILTASMNREYGKTCESVELSLINESYLFNNFTQGVHCINGTEQIIRSSDWSDTLYTKGFHSMVEHWLDIVRNRESNIGHTQRSYSTHSVCETITQHIMDRL
ncbi:Gfo/Idh/MocA family oxidoreductase [Enterovibrio makurazakiensis]|uniref:Gfo/Idh/MocA family protein n=1 Tax=Enterovibrio makurazakiensis TaxID=2910232 RepID=UPI003D196836